MDNLQEIIKQTGLQLVTENIIDPETNEQLPFDAGKVQRALEIVARSRRAIGELAEGINEFFENKLYLYFGMNKATAAKELFGMSVKSVQDLQAIHNAYGPELKAIDFIGISKLKLLKDVGENSRASLSKDGYVELADGTELTLDEIRNNTVNELREKIAKVTSENSKLSTRLKEAEKDQKAEVSILKEKIDELESVIEMSDEDKEHLHFIKKKKEAYDTISIASANFQAAFLRIGNIVNEDPEVINAIEGMMVYIAKQLLYLTEKYGVSLAHYNDAINAMAESR